MLNVLRSLIGKQIRASVTIQGNFTDPTLYVLQNIVKSWTIPGHMKIHGHKKIQIELEGSQAQLETRLSELGRHPLLVYSSVMRITWSPTTRTYDYFTISHEEAYARLPLDKVLNFHNNIKIQSLDR